MFPAYFFSFLLGFFCKLYCCVSDVNECSDSIHDCSEFAECVDAEGSYECLCYSGYVGNGTVCTSKIFVDYASPTAYWFDFQVKANMKTHSRYVKV